MKKGLLILISLLVLTVFLSCARSVKKAEDTSLYRPGVFKYDKSITFVFKAPKENVTGVHITGDFNNWNRPGIPMNLVDGLWTITLVLEYGIYQYKYVVSAPSGTVLVSDPFADAFAPDGKGGKNSILEVKKQ